MKHTMKKLLCMALAIMLLVSAVPVFAAAASNDVEYAIYKDGTLLESSTITGEDSATTLGTLLGRLYVVPEDYTVSYVKNGDTNADAGWSVEGTGTVKVEFRMTKKQMYLGVALNGVGSNATTKDINSQITLNADLLREFNLSLTTGKEIDYWTVAGQRYENGSSFTLTANTEVVCYQKLSGATAEPTVPTNPTTAAYVSVILSTKTSGFVAGDYINCNLVSGKITPTDRNTVAAAISSKGLNIVGWKRADNGQQASSLVDFDFAGLAEPINILPIFGASSPSNGGSNPGSSNTGSSYDYGTNGRYVSFVCGGQVIYRKLVKNDAELAVAKSEAAAKIAALGCYKLNGWK